jgi:hypothetical protein
MGTTTIRVDAAWPVVECVDEIMLKPQRSAKVGDRRGCQSVHGGIRTATWFSGWSAIAEFLPTGPLAEWWRTLPSEANGQPAFGCYAWNHMAGTFDAHSRDVVFTIGTRISGITSFLQPELLTRFDLPERLEPADRQSTPTTRMRK